MKRLTDLGTLKILSLCIHSFIHLLFLLRTNYVPGTDLNAEDTAVYQRASIATFKELTCCIATNTNK